MTQLPVKKITLRTHQYVIDDMVEPFRFIHFNLQAVIKMITNTVRNTVKEKK